MSRTARHSADTSTSPGLRESAPPLPKTSSIVVSSIPSPLGDDGSSSMAAGLLPGLHLAVTWVLISPNLRSSLPLADQSTTGCVRWCLASRCCASIDASQSAAGLPQPAHESRGAQQRSASTIDSVHAGRTARLQHPTAVTAVAIDSAIAAPGPCRLVCVLDMSTCATVDL